METVAEKFGQEKPGIEHVRGFCRVLVRAKAKKKTSGRIRLLRVDFKPEEVEQEEL